MLSLQPAVFSLLIILLFTPALIQSITLKENQLNYLASALSPRECRRLVASFQSNSYELPNNLNHRERKFPQGAKCTELLQKWYKEKGQDTSLPFLEVRLNQLNQQHLARWLSSEILEGLKEDFELFGDTKTGTRVKRSLADDFNETMREENLLRGDIHYIGVPSSGSNEKEGKAMAPADDTHDHNDQIDDKHHEEIDDNDVNDDDKADNDSEEDTEDDEDSWNDVDTLLAFLAGVALMVVIFLCLRSWFNRRKCKGCGHDCDCS